MRIDEYQTGMGWDDDDSLIKVGPQSGANVSLKGFLMIRARGDTVNVGTWAILAIASSSTCTTCRGYIGISMSEVFKVRKSEKWHQRIIYNL